MNTAKFDRATLAFFSNTGLLGRFAAVFALAFGTACSSDNNSDTIAQGQMYAMTRQCPLCHQSMNMSDGTLSGQTTVAPGSPSGVMAYGKNITPDPATGIGNWSDDQIIKAIREGINARGGTICSVMPRNSDMPDSEAKAIVAYLRSLPAVMRSIPDSVCPE